jgi:hypothetical protein
MAAARAEEANPATVMSLYVSISVVKRQFKLREIERTRAL